MKFFLLTLAVFFASIAYGGQENSGSESIEKSYSAYYEVEEAIKTRRMMVRFFQYYFEDRMKTPQRSVVKIMDSAYAQNYVDKIMSIDFRFVGTPQKPEACFHNKKPANGSWGISNGRPWVCLSRSEAFKNNYDATQFFAVGIHEVLHILLPDTKHVSLQNDVFYKAENFFGEEAAGFVTSFISSDGGPLAPKTYYAPLGTNPVQLVVRDKNGESIEGMFKASVYSRELGYVVKEVGHDEYTIKRYWEGDELTVELGRAIDLDGKNIFLSGELGDDRFYGNDRETFAMPIFMTVGAGVFVMVPLTLILKYDVELEACLYDKFENKQLICTDIPLNKDDEFNDSIVLFEVMHTPLEKGGTKL